MKVKILDHPGFRRGVVVDLETEMALELVRAGQAEPVAGTQAADRETR